MKDSNLGMLLTTLIVAPVMIICCGGGLFMIGALLGGAAGWFTGAGILTTGLIIAAFSIACLIFISYRRSCRTPAGPGEDMQTDER